MNETAQKPAAKPIAARLIGVLCSLRMAVVILILLAIVSAVGTMIPAGKEAAFYTGLYGETAGALIMKFGLDHVYHAWWFEALFVWLLVSMTVCSVRQTARLLRTGSRTDDPHAKLHPSKGCEHTFCWKPEGEDDGSLARAAAVVGNWLTRNHFRYREDAGKGDTKVLAAEQGRWGRGGALIIHIGAVVVLLGASVSRITGSTQKVLVFPDEITKVPETPLSVQLDDFGIDYYDDGIEVEEYRSSVTVTSESGGKQTGIIKVNKPLKIEGYNVYQMNFRTDADNVRVRAVRNEDKKDMGLFVLPMRTNVWIEGLGISLEATDFQPDFVMSAGRASSRSEHLANPAVHLLWKTEKGEGEKWIFADSIDAPAHSAPGALPYSFQLDGCKTRYISGLKIVRDIGKPVVYIGYLITVIGSFISCYVFHRRIRFELSSTADGVQIHCAAHASRNVLDLQYKLAQFREFVEQNPSMDRIPGDAGIGEES